MARAFIIRPFGKKKDSAGTEIDFDAVQEKLIEPALAETELGGGTTGEIIDSGNIREDMFSLILEADLIICDITIHNANVFYELGIRHALRKKRTILIKGEPTKDAPPFDILTDRYLPYQYQNPEATKSRLVEVITSTLKSERETDSPIFQMLPNLPEADPGNIQIVPLDFREEVDRAQAAQSKGWLRLLSNEVLGRRFQWTGLRLVAEAQWKLKDYVGARISWEAIREIYPEDITSNLALANIYERIYRSDQKPTLLEASDQAIKRVLQNNKSTRKDRVEALALEGRNLKTQWRRLWEKIEDIDERREAALNHVLCDSYSSYLMAFKQNLNHSYSGLTALQMGLIFEELATTNDSWQDIFENDETADEFRRKLNKDIEDLRIIVPVSVEAELSQMERDDPKRVWAEISKADLVFLSENREKRITSAYLKAIPVDNPFAWDAARGQLKLFEELGIKAELARNVIASIDGKIEKIEEVTGLPLHIILFVGHRVDTLDRSEPRFPAEKEELAKTLIREAIEKVGDDQHQIKGFASAAPGADILFHEVCLDMEIPSTICLPMPSTDFARNAFENLDVWRNRYLNLHSVIPNLVLSSQEGLPNWLHGESINPWERGNNWVTQMALSSDAVKITLIALWDRKGLGDDRGGTAHMVHLARSSGNIRVEIIDANQLI